VYIVPKGQREQIMTNYERAMITVPVGLLDRARKVGINVSATSATAIEKSIIALEKAAGEHDG
jgi:post-segregation antitoxin (ccd killing protein)